MKRFFIILSALMLWVAPVYAQDLGDCPAGEEAAVEEGCGGCDPAACPDEECPDEDAPAEEAHVEDAVDAEAAEEEDEVDFDDPELDGEPQTSAFLVGFLQGGGSLVGLDAEFLVLDRLGIQLGAGWAGFGAALNYHFQPTVHSNYLSLGYWHQGFDQTLSQQVIGITYGFRSFGWLTGQIGLGYVTFRGEEMARQLSGSLGSDALPPVLLLYSIGAYF